MLQQTRSGRKLSARDATRPASSDLLPSRACKVASYESFAIEFQLPGASSKNPPGICWQGPRILFYTWTWYCFACRPVAPVPACRRGFCICWNLQFVGPPAVGRERRLGRLFLPQCVGRPCPRLTFLSSVHQPMICVLLRSNFTRMRARDAATERAADKLFPAGHFAVHSEDDRSPLCQSCSMTQYRGTWAAVNVRGCRQ